MDSCEPLFDKPLTYEKGWGKNLTYCLAFSSQEVVDVSQRYVLDKMMNRMRRDQVNEKWLAETIRKRREQMWEMQGPQMAEHYKERLRKEMEEIEEMHVKRSQGIDDS